MMRKDVGHLRRRGDALGWCPVIGAEQQPEGDGQEPPEDEATTAPPTQQD